TTCCGSRASRRALSTRWLSAEIRRSFRCRVTIDLRQELTLRVTLIAHSAAKGPEVFVWQPVARDLLYSLQDISKTGTNEHGHQSHGRALGPDATGAGLCPSASLS